MAKAPAAPSTAANLGEELEKLFGKNDSTADDAGFISTGFLPLNHALSGKYYDGGIPRARIVEISGPPSAGKTSLFTDICIAAQRMGGFAALCDHERSFDGRLGAARGLDMSASKWWYRKPRTFEESIGLFGQVAVAIRASKRLGKGPIVWGFDSLAGMTPAIILDKMLKGEPLNMKDKLELAVCTSTYFKGVATICEDFDVTAVFLNQIRQKPGIVYGESTTTPGGDAPKFWATVRMQLGATRLLEEFKEGSETYKEQIGSEVTARIIKNKAYRPYKRAKWIFTFKEDGSGYFDAVGSIVDLLIARKLITKARPGYYLWEGVQRTRDQLVKILTDDPKGLKTLEDILIGNAVVADEDPDAAREQALAEAEAAATGLISDIAAE